MTDLCGNWLVRFSKRRNENENENETRSKQTGWKRNMRTSFCLAFQGNSTQHNTRPKIKWNN